MDVRRRSCSKKNTCTTTRSGSRSFCAACVHASSARPARPPVPRRALPCPPGVASRARSARPTRPRARPARPRAPARRWRPPSASTRTAGADQRGGRVPDEIWSELGFVGELGGRRTGGAAFVSSKGGDARPKDSETASIFLKGEAARSNQAERSVSMAMALRGLLLPLLLFLLLLVPRPQSCVAGGEGGGEPAEFEIPRDGSVLELDESNFEAAVRAAEFLFVDFYAPWCGHCKRLAPQLDEAAVALAGLSTPVVVAKVNADKYKKLGSTYGVDGFPTLMLFDHGVPSEYTGSRKADLLVENLKKLVAPDVSVLESDSSIKGFVEAAGINFPLFIGFGMDDSLIVEYGARYKKKAWFSTAKDFSEDMMVVYDFDKFPALVSVNPKYNEQSVFYGPFEGTFLEDFIRQSLLPVTVPVDREALKLLKDDGRKVVLTILEDESDENSPQLIKVLRSAANANHDLVFGYVGVKQWEEFTETFDVKVPQLPQIIVWDTKEEYEVVEGSESLREGDYGSQVSRFLEGYREGRTIKKKVGRGSPTLLGLNAVYILIFLVAVLVALMYFSAQGEEDRQPRRAHED